MRILDAYITRDYITAFLVSLAIFLFVMAVGNIFRVIDLFSRGVSGMLILQVFSYGIPFSLIFAIPMSVLAASFLQFSRMADDREIVAMKACGISVWQIVQPPTVVATALCLVCIYINCSLAPGSHFARRKVLGKLGVETPMNLIDEGRFIRDFPGLTIYVGRKYGHRLNDIVVHQFGDKGLKQTIQAKSGTIEADKNNRSKILVRLYQVQIDQADANQPDDLSLARHISADEYPMLIDMAELANREVVWKKRADLTMTEVISGIRGEPVFSSGDFTNPDSMANKLRQPGDRLCAYLRALLSERTRRMIDACDDSQAGREALGQALIKDFNKVIRRPDLYDPEAFQNARLSDKTRSLMNQHPAGVSLTRLNRKLLEDAFPNEIAGNLLMNLSPKDSLVHRMSLMVEASTRLALSFSCYAFVLLGAALGVKIHRKESSFGVAITLALIFVFYFFIIIADSLVSRPEFQPHLIIWFPFLLSEGIGFYLLRRSA